MGTRSDIGKVQRDGSIKHIYCHWDGYPSYNGAVLLGHWNDSNLVDSLLDLGYLSVLGFVVGEKHPFDRYQDVRSDKGPKIADQLPEKVENWCILLKRDRGDKGCEADISPNLNSFIKDLKDSDKEWVYLWENEQWMFSRTDDVKNRKPLTRENIELAIKEAYNESSWEKEIKMAGKYAGWEYKKPVSVE